MAFRNYFKKHVAFAVTGAAMFAGILFVGAGVDTSAAQDSVTRAGGSYPTCRSCLPD